MMQRMMSAAVLAATSATFAGTLECAPQQIAKLTADDGASNDNFGWSVATSGGVAVIGAWGDDDNGDGSGSAYVYEEQGDGTWQQTAKLTADDGASDDYFGFSVATAGGVVVIGAYYDDDNGSASGSAYVFEQQAGGTWQQIAKLTADDGAEGDAFGYSVALDAGVAVIGAHGDDDNGNLSGSAYIFEQQAGGTWQQIAKLTADDWAQSDQFGYSVATSGGVAVIGARYDEDNGSASGSAYVFEQQAGGTWQQIAKLTADDGAEGDSFGYSVATSGGMAVIGARYDDDNGSDSGSAYVFESILTDCNNNGICDADDLLDGTSADCNGNGIPDECDTADGTSFDCDQDLVPDECEIDCDGDGLIDDCDSEPDQDGNGVPDNCDPDCNENGIADGVEILFGWATDCDGNIVPDECQLADGSATDCNFDGTLDHCQLADNPDLDCDENGVLDSCEVEPVLTETAKLTADDGASGDDFGYSVATSGGVAVIGARLDDDNGTSSGSAYVYEQQADGTWQQVAKLTADDGTIYDFFGESVALDGGVAVIGAWGDDDYGTYSGSAYVYEQQADGTWQQTAKLTADDGEFDDRFGTSVALDAGVAVIGAFYDDDNDTESGSAYVYEQQADGTWQQIAKLTADDGDFGDRFGYSVATSGGVAVIGAIGWCGGDCSGSSYGSAYVFEQQADGTWQQIAKLTPDDGAEGDRFGYSVATSGGVAVIGAYYDDDNGTESGSAYVYEQQAGGTWQQIAKLTADDGASDDEFGISVALDGDVAVIGAWGDDDNGHESGSAYVYEQQADGTWQQVAKLTADDWAQSDQFGYSVATSGGVAVIGAMYDDDNGSESGSAYVFEMFSQADCDANGLMDDCEIEDEPSLDCDLDGVLDSCAIADGSVEDCNENGIPDSCDIADGGDADGDGYLDECECAADIAGPDGPGFPDGIVGTDDLLTVIGYWGSSIPDGDVNGDGIVGTDDLLAVIGAWGPCE